MYNYENMKIETTFQHSLRSYMNQNRLEEFGISPESWEMEASQRSSQRRLKDEVLRDIFRMAGH